MGTRRRGASKSASDLCESVYAAEENGSVGGRDRQRQAGVKHVILCQLNNQ